MSIKYVVPVLIVALFTPAIFLYLQNHSEDTSICSFNLPSNPQIVETGFRPVCGIRSVANGGISITVHNYYFSKAADIGFQFMGANESPLDPNDVFLLVNVSVSNTGNNNVTTGIFWALVTDVSNSNFSYYVTQYVANATFSSYPHFAFPSHKTWAGVVLTPGGHVDMWLIFYIPFPTESPENINRTSSYILSYLTYNQWNYEGQNIELIIKV
jgi:hypothetical protein